MRKKRVLVKRAEHESEKEQPAANEDKIIKKAQGVNQLDEVKESKNKKNETKNIDGKTEARPVSKKFKKVKLKNQKKGGATILRMLLTHKAPRK